MANRYYLQNNKIYDNWTDKAVKSPTGINPDQYVNTLNGLSQDAVNTRKSGVSAAAGVPTTGIGNNRYYIGTDGQVYDNWTDKTVNVNVKPDKTINDALSGMNAQNSGEVFDRKNPSLVTDSTGVAANNSATNNSATTSTVNTGISDLNQSILNGKISDLNYAKEKSLGNLNLEKSKIEPEYYTKRNQTQSAADLGQLNFAQFRAANGLKGEAGTMQEIYRNNSLQTNLGTLNAQEQAAKDDVERRKTEVNNDNAHDIASVTNEATTQTLQDNKTANENYIANVGNLSDTSLTADITKYTGSTNADDIAKLTALTNEQQNRTQKNETTNTNTYVQGVGGLSDKQIEADIKLYKGKTDPNSVAKYTALINEKHARAEEKTQTGKTDWINTYQGVYTTTKQCDTAITRLQKDGDPSNDWKINYLKAQKNEIKAAQAEANSKYSQAQIDWAWKAWEKSGVASKDVAKILGIPVGAKTVSYLSATKVSSRSSGGSGSKSNKPISQSQVTTQVGNFTSYINNTYVYGGASKKMSMQEKRDTATYIVSLVKSGTVDEKVTDALFAKYGIDGNFISSNNIN